MTSGSGGLSDPYGLVFGPGANLYVSSTDTGEVLRYNGVTGAFIDAFVPAGSGGLDSATYPLFRPAVAAVPEPGTLALLAVGGMGAIALRRRKTRA